MYKTARNIFLCVSTVFLALYQSPVSALDLELDLDYGLDTASAFLDSAIDSASNLTLDLVSISASNFLDSASDIKWTLRPRISLAQMYSDNIRLTATDEKAALVTELRSGISINSNSSRGNLDLDYSLQGIYNAQGDSGVDIYNQLQMDADYEFVRNSFFVESAVSIGQQNSSNRRIVNDNVSGSDASSTITTFMLSPYWTPHFRGFADGEFRLTYDRVSSARGNDSLSTANTWSQDINLTSGHDFSLFSWSFSFNNRSSSSSAGQDVSYQDTQFETRYAIARKYSVFARLGHSANSFSSNTDSHQNGVFYTFGGQWKPSKRFSIEAGYGNNKFITVELSPFNRLHWITTYSKNDIGLNTGDKWETELNYSARRSTWKLSYTEDTTTAQQTLLDQQIFTSGNTFGGQTQTPYVNRRELGLTSLTDEVFISKTAEASVSFRTGKSNISAEVYKILRTYEQSGNEEKVEGISASWGWQFSRRSRSNLRGGWQKTESDGFDAFSDDRLYFSATITRNFLAHLNGSIEYQYVDQNSNDKLNEYLENRITAKLTLQF
jgi:hypothetical protein